MNPNRMTVEELNALKPSYDNPIELVCDDGGFMSALERIVIVTPYYNEKFCFIDDDGDFDIGNKKLLIHYPSLKQQDKRELLLEAAKPLIKFINQHGHPHAKVIVDTTHAELVEGTIAVKTEEFLRD